MTDLERLEKKIDQILTYLEEIRPKKKPTLTLYEWFDIWYDTYKAHTLKKNSLRCIRDTIRLHIKPNLPDQPIQDITPIDLTRCLNAIQSSRMAEYSHNTLTDCFRRAYEQGILDIDVMTTVAKPKHRRNVGHALTREEQAELMGRLPELKHGEIFAFYLYTGCRRSEALAITWQDVDRKQNVLHVPGTKTATSDRYVPILPKLKKLLRDLPHGGPSARLFPYSDSTIKREYEKLRALCSFDFTIHSLRHTYITRLHEQGIDDKVIQKWAGHSSVTTTQKIYIHVMTEQEKLQVMKLAKSDLF